MLTKVSIGNDCWIGNGAIVMADVGNQCVIAAGAVVVDAVGDRSIVGGNPATLIRQRGKETEAPQSGVLSRS